MSDKETMVQKAGFLKECLNEEMYEDAWGHLLELLKLIFFREVKEGARLKQGLEALLKQ